jgi:hypothetical protein
VPLFFLGGSTAITETAVCVPPERGLPMQRVLRRGIAVLALTLLTVAAASAAPISGRSIPVRASLWSAAWTWIVSRLQPAPPVRPAVPAKAGCEMDPNGGKLVCAPTPAPPLSDAGCDIDPDGSH